MQETWLFFLNGFHLQTFFQQSFSKSDLSRKVLTNPSLHNFLTHRNETCFVNCGQGQGVTRNLDVGCTPNIYADGVCDCECLYSQCNWDGGDCEPQTLPKHGECDANYFLTQWGKKTTKPTNVTKTETDLCASSTCKSSESIKNFCVPVSEISNRLEKRRIIL